MQVIGQPFLVSQVAFKPSVVPAPLAPKSYMTNRGHQSGNSTSQPCRVPMVSEWLTLRSSRRFRAGIKASLMPSRIPFAQVRSESISGSSRAVLEKKCGKSVVLSSATYQYHNKCHVTESSNERGSLRILFLKCMSKCVSGRHCLVAPEQRGHTRHTLEIFAVRSEPFGHFRLYAVFHSRHALYFLQ